MSKFMTIVVAAAALAGGLTGAVDAAQAGGVGPLLTAAQKANGSGVIVRYRVDGTPKVGQASTITLEFAGVTDAAGATARFTSDAELTLDAGTPKLLGLAQGSVTGASIRVTPTAEGRFYVNIFTAQRGARSVASVAVQVGDKPVRAKPQAADESESVIVMPVE